MIPLRDENPSHRRPLVMRAIISLNLAAFAYELSLGPGLRAFFFEWGMVPARVTWAFAGFDSPLAASLTFVTSMFLHGGVMHLVGNLWYLWIFGDNVEDRLGHARFLAFYLAAGVVAALIQYATHPEARVPMVGASGAIAGVLGGYLVAFPRARIITLLPLFPFFQVVALPAVIVLGLWFLFQFFSGALALAGAPGGGIAWWAHIGGFAFGIVGMRLFGERRRRGGWRGVADDDRI
uniref:Rhomboid family intramembrane serine protease n=1 Tax=Eiseniibacteriota bacterium TaxID=2212470 RepID=A0A832I035_UNCEI